MSERMCLSGPKVEGWVRGGVLLWLLGAASLAPAQIRIGLKYEHSDVLQFEAVRVFVTVYNDTPDVLRLGGGPADRVLILDFQVEDSTGLPRVQSGREPLCEGVSIVPGGRHTLLLDVTRRFPMIQLQYYRVMVEGHWKGRRYESNPVQIHVVAGLVLSEVKKTAPGYEDRVRTYSLRYWRREKTEHLFLRVDELADGRNLNYGTVDIGPVIRVFRPRLEVD